MVPFGRILACIPWPNSVSDDVTEQERERERERDQTWSFKQF